MLEILNRLTQDEQGIYRGNNTSPISYPADGNKDCFLLEDDSYWFKHRNECITSVIKSYPPNGPIIDVGGGNGFVSRGILDAGFDAVLLEPGVEGAINGKIRRQIPTVICSTFQDADFEPNSLHAVGCFDVVEHIEDDYQIIDDLYKALKPGGLLYVTVPAYNILWSQSDVSGLHYRRYNRNMIDKLLSGRFEMLYFTYFFTFLILPIFFFRALPFRLGFSKKSVLSKKTEHGTNKGLGAELINYFIRREKQRIQNGKGIKFGASCLFVARKIN